MEQQKHRKPARNFTVRKGGYITKSQLGKRGTLLSDSQLLDFEVERKLGRQVGDVTVITKEKITQTRLISERGWTKGLINELLGEPDVFVDNPHYKSAAPMRLYFLDRVKHIEQTSDVFKSRRKDRRKSPIKKRNPPNYPNI